MRETVYKEWSCHRWNYWTYADGQTIYISKNEYEKMIRQGAKVVHVK
jgi:hypothetical protein